MNSIRLRFVTLCFEIRKSLKCLPFVIFLVYLRLCVQGDLIFSIHYGELLKSHGLV